MCHPDMNPQLNLDFVEFASECSGTFSPTECARFGEEHDLPCDVVKPCRRSLPNWEVTLSHADGYELPITPNVVPVPMLPKVVHTIKGDQRHHEFLRAVKDNIWATTYQRAIAGDLYRTQRLNEWRGRQRIPATKRLLLHQETNDAELEKLFHKTYHPNFFPIIQASPNNILVSPGYSVYSDRSMCRHLQLLNLKRSADFFKRASEHGLPCIPCFGWNLRQDLVRIAEWVNAHPDLRYIAINCQTLKRKAQYPKLCEEIAFIEQFSRPLHWIVFGGVRAVTYLQQGGLTGRITLVTAEAAAKANSGRSLDKQYRSPSKAALFQRSQAMIEAAFHTGFQPLTTIQ